MEYYREFQGVMVEARLSLSEDKYKNLNKKILIFSKKASDFKKEGFDPDIYKETFDYEQGMLADLFNYLFEIKDEISDSVYVFLNNKIREISEELNNPDKKDFDVGARFKNFEYMCSLSKLFQNYRRGETKLDLLRVPKLGRTCANELIEIIKLERYLEEDYPDIPENRLRLMLIFVIKLDFVMHNLRLIKVEENIIPLYRKRIMDSLENKYFKKILEDSEFDYNIWLKVFDDVQNGIIEIPDDDGKEYKCNCKNNNAICCGFFELRKCRNFERFIKMNPVVNGLYNSERVEPVKQPNIGKCFPDAVILNNHNNLLQLLFSMTRDRHRDIVNTAVFDFLMRNAKYLKKNRALAAAAYCSVREVTADESFVNFMTEIEFDWKIWHNTFFQYVQKK